MPPRSWGPRPLPMVCAALALAAAAAAQEPASVPSFKAGTAVITVDAAVLDREGRPLRGLTRDDFTILEDGKPQPIVAFEVRDLPREAQSAEQQKAAAVGLPGDGDDAPAGRTLAFIVDDEGLGPLSYGALNTIRRWVEEKSDPRDDLTIATTSGLVQWSGRLGSGRGGALAALASIRLRRRQGSSFTPVSGDASRPALTEQEAYLIATGRKPAESAEVMGTAQTIYSWWANRVRTIAAAAEDFAAGHATARGRKPIFVFTEGLIREDDLKLGERIIDASQRANTPLYFVDTRGLVAGEGQVRFEATHHIDTAGADQIALQTGGASLRDSNDFMGGLTRAVDESTTYYLLGYQPAQAPDGKWHQLEVKVDRAQATVRARRGYYASDQPLSAELDRAVKKDKKETAAAPAPAASPAAATTAGAPPPASAPAPAVPTFGATAEAVTVDVVVLDKEGHPVTDLQRGDFVLSEDGRPQDIVGFEPRAFAAGAGPAEAEAEAAAGTASNERGSAPGGRTLAFLVDDLGIGPLRMGELAKAISRWLADGAAPGDEVTLVTTSGDAWWSDSVGGGRDDLLAVLAHLKGKKGQASTLDAMSDFEAYSIDVLGTSIESDTLGPSVLDRVVDRWLRNDYCIRDGNNPAISIRSCRSQATARARQVYAAARARGVNLLAAVERLSTGLSGARGRKTVIVLSEGLLRDTEQRAFERAVDASRRGNTAVSFVDVRGLTVTPLMGADQRQAPRGGDLGSAIIENSILETAGGEYMAETTGGSIVRNTNDIGGSVRRLADEGAAYYLLGYQPDRPNDGRWRKLTVKVARPGLTVRARKGYFATAAPPLLAVANVKDKKNKKNKKDADQNLPPRPLDPALGVGGARDQLPLRVAAHVLEMDAAGRTRVLVALELNTAAVSFAGTGGERTAQLDVTVLGLSRDQAKAVPVDSHVVLGVDARATGAWYVFTRELRMPPGPAQIRALVRDTITGRSGLVTQRLEIPSGQKPYISTPILSDRVVPDGTRGQRMVVAAHRTFAARGQLFCTYEVYPAPGRQLQQLPHVEGSFRLEDADGRQVAAAPPTPIAMTVDARFVRMVAVPLDGLAPGRYRLVLEAADKAAGLSLEAQQVFFVEAPARAAGED